MNRIIFLLAAFLLASSSLTASAATLTVSPTTVAVRAGQTFTLTVNVDAQGSRITTSKAELSYPSNLLEATNFTFSNGWIPLTQSGYDQMGNGTVIKTGGFPGGFTGVKSLGTVTFRARQVGTANVNVTNGSLALSDSGDQVLSTRGSAVATISAAIQPEAPANTSARSNPAVQNSSSQAVRTSDTPVSSDTGTDGVDVFDTPAGDTAGGNNQAAAVAAAGESAVNPTNRWLLGLVALIAVGAGYWAYSRYSAPKA